MVIETPFSLRNESGDDIRGDLRYVTGERPLPLLLVCHGFTAHKNWGPFPYFGRKFAALGFASAVFNFSHNGMGGDFRRFTELAKFSRNTIGKELEDVRAILRGVEEGTLGSGIVDRSRIGIVGHSRGGGVAILSASRERTLGGVAAWSTVATFQRYTAHQREMWERQGYLPVTVRGTRTNLKFGIEVLRDLEANSASYDLYGAVRSLDVPLLLIHGAADVSVKPDEPRSLYEASDRTKTELVMIDGTGHAFGAGHPFRAGNPALDHVVERTAEWFHGFL